jgi:hypothetical protein
MSNSSKFGRSVDLLRVSLRTIVKNRKLLFFPVVNFVFCLLILATFFCLVIFQTGHSHSSLSVDFPPRLPVTFSQHVNVQWEWFALCTGLYFSLIFCSTFLNVAFYHEITKALSGEPVSLLRGFAFARQRIRATLVWSLFAGSVGVLIRLFSKHLGFISNFVTGIIGFAWSVAGIFVIPLIVRHEDSNPIVLLKDSAATIKKTWGEFLIGYVGIQFPALIMLFALPILCSLFLLLIWVGTASVTAVFYSIIVICLALLSFFVLLATANDIFRCALYVYASEGVVPEPYSREMLDSVWRVKTP